MSELLDIATALADRAGPDEEVEAFVVRHRGTEVRAYDGAVESLTVSDSAGVGVRVVAGGRQGFSYAGTLEAGALDEVLAEARDNARFGTVDPDAGVAAPDGVPVPALDLFRPSLSSVPTDDKVELALALEKATRAADGRIIGVESAEYSDVVGEMAVATSAGVAAEARETACYLASYALASADDDTQTGFGFSVGREPADLDPEAAAADAAHRATRLLGARKAPSGRLTVVLDPFVTAQLLGIIGSTLSGEAVLKGRSLFADRVGEEVAPPWVRLVDDPTDARAFTAGAIDAEGLASRPVPLLADGVLRGFLHNTYTARRAGTSSTASAVRGYSSPPGVGARALRLEPGDRSPEELIADIDDGFLVQHVAGLHSGVNPVSGDFSTGAEGLRIRRGETAEPVREVTIASTLQRLLLDIRAVGSDLEFLPLSAAGVSLVIDDVTLSGA